MAIFIVLKQVHGMLAVPGQQHWKQLVSLFLRLYPLCHPRPPWVLSPTALLLLAHLLQLQTWHNLHLLYN